jgi:hypothetical protein
MPAFQPEMSAGIPLVWSARSVPLPAQAVVGRGAAGRALARRLLAGPATDIGQVRACAGAGVLVVIGAEASLPWVEGAFYLGHDAGAPALLLPTNRTPGVPADLLAEALARRLGRGPWAAFPDDAGALVAVAVGAAGPVARAALEGWLEGP